MAIDWSANDGRVADAAAAPVRRSAARHRTALAVMVASGFAGLGYQIVWTQQFALWLGHDTAAVLAVVAAFFGGLSVGALGLGRWIERSARPARWYAACEVVIAVWSVAVALLMVPVGHGLLSAIGAQPSPWWQSAMAFAGVFFVLLPATAAMGGTLPAMERVVDKIGREGQSIAALYACNTLGAVVGVLAAAFWLVPTYGLAGTAVACAVLNVLCAAAAMRFPHSGAPRPAVSAKAPTDNRRWTMLATLAFTGLLGIGYELLVVRVLSQVAEDTVYTFAMLLAVYLVGSALGAAAYQRWLAAPLNANANANANASANALRARLLGALALACLCGTASLWAADAIKMLVVQALPPSMAGALAAEAVLALAAFGLPTVVMGALFSHLASQAQSAGIGFGHALGVNTLGAAAAPLLFGVGLVPVVGLKFALLTVVVGYLALVSPRAWRQPLCWLTGAAAIGVAVWAPPLAFITVPDGGRVVSYQEGAMAAVSVVEDAQGVLRLRIDNRQQEGSSATLLSDARQALLPLLLHPAPQRALFLGLGTGVTAASAAEDPTLQVDVAELLPEVIAASPHFTREFNGGAPNPRLHLIAADARRFVRTTSHRYDVIVSDNFHPARSGSGSLTTVEHFAAVRDRLTADGLFCQWLPLHQLDLDTLRSIVESFLVVYPQGSAMLATNSLDTPVLGLVARRDAGRFSLSQAGQRLNSTQLPQRLNDFGLADGFALLGNFVAGPQALSRFADRAQANTDDHPVVAYRAPRITYAPDSLPRDRLLALLKALAASPTAAGDLIDTGTDAAASAAASARLAAYWSARDQFIAAGRDIRPVADAQSMLAQVRGPLLAVLATSPDFRPAYDPLLRMALAVRATDPSAARDLLLRLQQLQPARPEAARALQQWAAAAP
jgi:spermidine synthase